MAYKAVVFFLVSIVATTLASPATLASNITWNTFSNVKIFGPGSGYTAPGVLYGRVAIIEDTLYATAENCEY